MTAAASTRIAERIARLGTETAFAVSAEAAAFAAAGNDVYPFHLGDLDLPTPRQRRRGVVQGDPGRQDGLLPERRHRAAARGPGGRRERLARRAATSADNVVIEPGGKPVIGKFILALMNPGDEVLYPNPGYPIYESQIEFHGGVAVPYGYLEGDRTTSRSTSRPSRPPSRRAPGC